MTSVTQMGETQRNGSCFAPGATFTEHSAGFHCDGENEIE